MVVGIVYCAGLGGKDSRGEVGEVGLASWVRMNSMAVSCLGSESEKWRECGERRKSRDQDLGALGEVEEPFLRSSRMRFWGRGSLERSEGKRESGTGLNETSGSCSISRISFMVNAPWTGPLRPTM